MLELRTHERFVKLGDYPLEGQMVREEPYVLAIVFAVPVLFRRLVAGGSPPDYKFRISRASFSLVSIRQWCLMRQLHSARATRAPTTT